MSVESWLLAHEAPVRLGLFASFFAGMALWEVIRPRRVLRVSKGKRWAVNLGLVVLNTTMLRIIFPAAAVGVAMYAESAGFGLFNMLPVPHIVAIVASILLLDFALTVQHAIFHRVPFLWRLHQMHHADTDFDVSLATRFHPLEMLASMGIKAALVTMIGAPAVAVLVFEVLLSVLPMFNHGNVSLPPAVDRIARWVIVTPDMHRIHHSSDGCEVHTNFGFNLSVWDRLLGTYRDKAKLGQDDMEIGLPEWQEDEVQGLAWLLQLPFAERSTPRCAQ